MKKIKTVKKMLLPKTIKKTNSKKIKIGIVTARFNGDITEKLEEGALDYLDQLDVDVFSIRVPGAIEIAIAAQALFEYQKVDGIIALGAVIRGETTHYEEVCRSVERNCSRLMLDYKKPISFGVLTVENETQALDRVGGKHGHKGAEAAQAVVEMIGLLTEIKKK